MQDPAKQTPTGWAVLWASPRPLFWFLGFAVFVFAYEAAYYVLRLAEGYPKEVTIHGAVFPYLQLGIAATLLLAVGTGALAYAALRQATAAEALLGSASGQASATGRLAVSAEKQALAAEAQLSVAREQLKVTRDQAEIARLEVRMLQAQAETQESIRRASTFPEVRLVTSTTATGSEPVILVPGNQYPQFTNPMIGIQNFGAGPARLVKVVASWKLLDFGKTPADKVSDTAKLKWEPVPEAVPLISRLEPRSAQFFNTLPWTSRLVAEGRQTVMPVAIYVKVRWTDPDGKENDGPVGGLLLLPGTMRPGPGTGLVSRDYVGLGVQDCPELSTFSQEPPVVI